MVWADLGCFRLSDGPVLFPDFARRFAGAEDQGMRVGTPGGTKRERGGRPPRELDLAELQELRDGGNTYGRSLDGWRVVTEQCGAHYDAARIVLEKRAKTAGGGQKP